MNRDIDFYRFLLDHSTNIFLELDSYGKVLFATAKACYIFHNSAPQGQKLDKLLGTASAAAFLLHIRSVMYQHYPENFTLEFSGRFYNTFIYPYQQNCVACLEDITERRQLSHHLHQSRRRMEFAERTARLGYWELDLVNRRFYWSAEMYRIFGIDPQGLSAKKNLIRERILPEDLPIYKKELAHLLKSSAAVEGRVRVRRPDETIAVCVFRAGIIHDERGERIAGTFQDITPLASVQQALQQACSQAESLNLAKSYFLAQASHDLRQPMQALNMFIAALNDDKLSPCQQDIVAKIDAAAAHLKSLLDNLLDISKLDCGGMEYIPERFNLAELLIRLCTEYQTIAASQKLDLICRPQPVEIISDPLLIERILRNLLGNAFKYAKSKIILSCSQNGSETVIRVTDNGIGISAENISRIFEEYYQIKDQPDNRRQGAGLGLNIVKKIATVLHARVTVKSRPGHYTVFSVYLPEKP